MIISPPNLTLNWLEKFQKNIKIYINIDFFFRKNFFNANLNDFDIEALKNFFSTNYDFSQFYIVYKPNKNGFVINKLTISDIMTKLQLLNGIKIIAKHKHDMKKDLKETSENVDLYQARITFVLFYFINISPKLVSLFKPKHNDYICDGYKVYVVEDNNNSFVYFQHAKAAGRSRVIDEEHIYRLYPHFCGLLRESLHAHYKNYLNCNNKLINSLRENITINNNTASESNTKKSYNYLGICNILTSINNQFNITNPKFIKEPLYYSLIVEIHGIISSLIKKQIIGENIIKNIKYSNLIYNAELTHSIETTNQPVTFNEFKIALLKDIHEKLIPQIESWNNYKKSNKDDQIER